ncbi:MAG TPA: ParB/RepB/Spo0J family partition protein [Candidatus Limnocylindrales bacterium]|nr:ParB/RepB/Spo0J family partition protein [Candidatus Limnocylindrales bacterium]
MTPLHVERHTGLGRGLGALIPQTNPTGAAAVEIPISRIRGNPYQPRQHVEQQSLESLASSIATHGVLQPVIVTEVLDGYQLVAGERRVRAAQMAGLDHVPAIVRQMIERDQLAVALVENVQRADLNAMEEAHAYRQLADEFGLTQDDIAGRVGRARSTVANTLRLLELEPSVQQALGGGDITEGHARALAGATPAAQRQLVETVMSRGLSVRQTEELVRRLRDRPASKTRTATDSDVEMERLEGDLRRALGTKVLLARSRKGGRIVIEYYSDEEFSRLFDRLTGGDS